MKNIKKERNYRKALIWATSIVSMACSGLSLLCKPNTKSCDEDLCNYQKEEFKAGGTPLQNLATQPGMPNGLGGGLPFPFFPPSGDGFLPDSFINSLPYDQLYHGSNQARYCEQPVFVKDYFRNMTSQFPTNDDEQNCGYVALAMLLSYYDAYWNSSFVEEKYEVAGKAHLDSLSDADFISPGVKDLNLDVWGFLPNHLTEPTKPCESDFENDDQYQQAVTDYWNEMYTVYDNYLERMVTQQNINQFLMSYLYKIALEKRQLVYHTNSIPRIGLEGLKIVADEYFSRSESLSGKVTLKYSLYDDSGYLVYQTEDEKRDAIRRDAIKKIKKGCPVILAGNLYDSEGHEGDGHIVVAYKYDEQNDVIYGHSGWKIPNSSNANMDETFYNYRGYAYIEVSDSLRYSPNNKKFEVGGIAYDTLSLSSHVHGFEGGVSYSSDSMHAVQCPCGETKYAFHTMQRVSNRYVKCKVCGHYKEDYDPDWRPNPYGL